MHCTLCNAALAGSEAGRAAHYQKYHNVLVRREYKPMDPGLKASITLAFDAKNQGAVYVPQSVHEQEVKLAHEWNRRNHR